MTKMYFPSALEVGSPRPRCQQGWFLLRLLSVADGHFLAGSSCVLPPVCAQPWYLSVLSLSSYKDTSHSELGPTLVASFYLYSLFLQIQLPSEVLVVRISACGFRGETNMPIIFYPLTPQIRIFFIYKLHSSISQQPKTFSSNCQLNNHLKVSGRLEVCFILKQKFFSGCDFRQVTCFEI